MTRPAAVPSCQMDLDEAVRVDEAEGWLSVCSRLDDGAHRDPLQVQGGRAGLVAHAATVHGVQP